MGTHDARGTRGVLALGEEIRNDGVKGAFVRHNLIGMAGNATKSSATIMQRNSGSKDQNATAEGLIIRFN